MLNLLFFLRRKIFSIFLSIISIKWMGISHSLYIMGKSAIIDLPYGTELKTTSAIASNLAVIDFFIYKVGPFLLTLPVVYAGQTVLAPLVLGPHIKDCMITLNLASSRFTSYSLGRIPSTTIDAISSLVSSLYDVEIIKTTGTNKPVIAEFGNSFLQCIPQESKDRYSEWLVNVQVERKFYLKETIPANHIKLNPPSSFNANDVLDLIKAQVKNFSINVTSAKKITGPSFDKSPKSKFRK